MCIYLPTCYSLLVVVVHMAGRAKAAGKSEEVIYPIRQDWEDTSHPIFLTSTLDGIDGIK